MIKSRIKERRGATAVEFALTLPVLIIFMFATYEFGRANMMLHTAEAAAYEAARVGIIPNKTAAEVIDACEGVLATAGIRNARILVTPRNLENPTETVRVEVFFRYQDNSVMFPFFMDDDARVQKSCEMTREGL